MLADFSADLRYDMESRQHSAMFVIDVVSVEWADVTGRDDSGALVDLLTSLAPSASLVWLSTAD